MLKKIKRFFRKLTGEFYRDEAKVWEYLYECNSLEVKRLREAVRFIENHPSRTLHHGGADMVQFNFNELQAIIRRPYTDDELPILGGTK